MYQTGTHGSVGGRLANQSSASYPISYATIRIRQSTSFLCERAILWYHRRAQEIRKEQKQMKKKIAFFDIDGTLIDMERKKMSDHAHLYRNRTLSADASFFSGRGV